MLPRKGLYKFYPVRLLVRAFALILVVWALISLGFVLKPEYGYSIGGIALFSISAVAMHHLYARMGWERRSQLTDNLGELMDQSPYEFEHTIAKLLQRMGYSARVTSKSDGEEGGDYGADIIAKKDGRTIVVQVKRWAPHNLVGALDVRSTLGCLHTFKASKAILVTTSDFTEQAYVQAKNGPVELWNGARLRELMAKYV